MGQEGSATRTHTGPWERQAWTQEQNQMKERACRLQTSPQPLPPPYIGVEMPEPTELQTALGWDISHYCRA